MNEYKTRDFYLTAYLMAVGHSFTRKEKNETQKYIFVFNHTPELQAEIDAYYGLRATVRPQDYTGAMKSLKAIFYAENSTS